MSDTIFLIMGKSGAGKDAVVNALCKKYGLARLNSYTTRPRRGPGDLHEFVLSYAGWLEAHPDDPVVGYTYFADHHYWASQSQVDAADLYVIDPDGVEWFRNHYNGSKAIFAIYIDVPWYKRLMRMWHRGDGFLAAMRRLAHDHRKFASVLAQADSVVGNDELSDCVADIADLIRRMGGIE